MKKISYILISITLTFLSMVALNATTIDSDDIPNGSYVIGKHVFTRGVTNDNYDGKLTMQLIMLAAKTIESDNLEDMVIYYKTSNGYIDPTKNGVAITAPETFEIDYQNVSLEEENSTVTAPSKPIVAFDVAQTYNETTNRFSAGIWVFIDDISKNEKVDGVELRVVQNGNTELYNTYDLTYNEYFANSTATITEAFKLEADGIVIGNTYHSTYINIDNIPIYNADDITINARAYVLDANSNKVYSDMFVDSIKDEDFLPHVNIVSTHSNPDYISKDNNYYYYELAIEQPYGWTKDRSSSSRNKYGYNYSCSSNGTLLDYGIKGLDDTIMLNVPINSVTTCKAQIGYWIDSESFISYGGSNKVLTIDTRSLTKPVLSDKSQSYYYSNGEYAKNYLTINQSYYENAEEGTLDANYGGFEIYEFDYSFGGKKYTKLTDSRIGYFTHTNPSKGISVYVARVYATKEDGTKIYSDFSDEVVSVRIPEIKITKLYNETVKVSINNKDDFSQYMKYDVYKVVRNEVEDVLLASNVNVATSTEVEVELGDIIYVIAKESFDQNSHSSVHSNEVTVELAAPVLTVTGLCFESDEDCVNVLENGKYQDRYWINYENYSKTIENTMYSSITGYEVYLKDGSNYTLAFDSSTGEKNQETLPEVGKSKTYVARVYAEKANGDRVYSDYSEEVEVDYTTYETPVLTVTGLCFESDEDCVNVLENGKYQDRYWINYENYSKTIENTMYSSITGYEVYLKDGSNYTLAFDSSTGEKNQETLPEVGKSKTYVARVYAEKANGDRVYSDYSEEVVKDYTTYKRPELHISYTSAGLDEPAQLVDGKYVYDAVSIDYSSYMKVLSSHMYSSISGWELYEVENAEYIKVKESINGPDEVLRVEILPGEKKTYVARVYAEKANGDKIYSDYSEEVVKDHTN